MFKYLQKVGKSFMLPIAILPAAGLLLGIGGAFSSEATIAAYPMLDVYFLQVIFQIMSAAGNVIFGNLSLLLCIGLCVGLAKKDKGTAALAGVVGFLVMNGTISAMLSIFNPEGNAIDTGVIGALVMGLIAVTLHNRYQNIQLPQKLGFFGGSRFVPIVTSVSAIFILEALGGRENIEDVDACITRLRVAVKDSSKVDKETLKKVGATAVLDVQGGIQAIYGAKAILYKNEINDILGVAD